jgi:hypothetical protein
LETELVAAGLFFLLIVSKLVFSNKVYARKTTSCSMFHVVTSLWSSVTPCGLMQAVSWRRLSAIYISCHMGLTLLCQLFQTQCQSALTVSCFILSESWCRLSAVSYYVKGSGCQLFQTHFQPLQAVSCLIISESWCRLSAVSNAVSDSAECELCDTQ